MFQQVFRAQSEALLTLPLFALGLFVFAFVARVIHTFRMTRGAVDDASRLPLVDDDAGAVHE